MWADVECMWRVQRSSVNLDPRLADLILSSFGRQQPLALRLRRLYHPIALVALEDWLLRHKNLLLAIKSRRKVVRRNRSHRVARECWSFERRRWSAEKAPTRSGTLDLVVIHILLQLRYEVTLALNLREIATSIDCERREYARVRADTTEDAHEHNQRKRLQRHLATHERQAAAIINWVSILYR